MPYDVNSDSFPNDDYYIEQWKRTILNRIDREWTCDEIIHDDEYYASGYGYCGVREHDPFTDRCWDHTPDK